MSVRLWLCAHKTPVYSIHVLQGSVATRLRCGGILMIVLLQIFRRVCRWKKITKIRWKLTKLLNLV